MGKGKAVDCNFLNLSLIISLCFGVLLFFLGLWLVIRIAYESEGLTPGKDNGPFAAGAAVVNVKDLTVFKNGTPTAWYIVTILVALGGLIQTIVCAVALKININFMAIMGAHIATAVLCAMAILAYVAQDAKLPMFPGWIISLCFFDIVAITAGIILKFTVFKK